VGGGGHTRGRGACNGSDHPHHGYARERERFAGVLGKAGRLLPRADVSYVSDYPPGQVKLRPWMFGVCPSYGNMGIIINETLRNQILIIVARAALTDSSQINVEPLAVVQPNPVLLKTPIGPAVVEGLLPSHSNSFVKGWTRAVAVAAACRVIMTLDLKDKLPPPSCAHSPRHTSL
jgi:hypothetical protein